MHTPSSEYRHGDASPAISKTDSSILLLRARTSWPSSPRPMGRLASKGTAGIGFSTTAGGGLVADGGVKNCSRVITPISPAARSTSSPAHSRKPRGALGVRGRVNTRCWVCRGTPQWCFGFIRTLQAPPTASVQPPTYTPLPLPPTSLAHTARLALSGKSGAIA
jgi:hypothetical protein